MSTSTKWLDNGAKERLGYNTYFNVMSRLSQNVGVAELANYIINPGVTSLFSNPSDWLSSLIYYPFDVNYNKNRTEEYTDGDCYLQIGSQETQIPCEDVNPALATFYMGEYFLPRSFINFADFNGYTIIDIYLPYLGFVSINPNDVLDKYIQFRLGVDYTTGTGTYYIGVSDETVPPSADGITAVDSNYNIRIISTYNFQLGSQVPLGSTNTVEVYRNIIMNSVRGVAYASASYAASQIGGSQSTTQTVRTVRNPSTNRQITQGKTTTTKEYDDSNYYKGRTVGEIFDSSSSALNAFHSAVNTDRPNNTLSLCNGSKSIQIVIRRPKIKPIDDDYRHLFGIPFGQTKLLNEIRGYTKISNIHLEASLFGQATQKEIAMLESIITDGIIL